MAEFEKNSWSKSEIAALVGFCAFWVLIGFVLGKAL